VCKQQQVLRGVDRMHRQRQLSALDARLQRRHLRPVRRRHRLQNGMAATRTAHTCTVTGGSGQICSPGDICNSGLLCIDESGPFGPVCRPSCNPYASTCATGTVCSWIDFDSTGAFEGYCSAPNNHGALGAALRPVED